VSSMTKMSLFGVDQSGLIDCTSALPNPKDGGSFGALSGGALAGGFKPPKY
jgi:hypothetical protein